jgi:glycerol-3-phosphate O-acyltransferase/dihydroxyacetone phosphate acyltransferase
MSVSHVRFFIHCAVVMVPSLWLFYAFLLIVFTDLDGPTIALIVFSFPLFAYMGIVVAEAGMVDLMYVRPYLMRLSPRTRHKLATLPERRRALQADLRAFIKAIGPGLGELYYAENLDWQRIMEASKSERTEPKKGQ